MSARKRMVDPAQSHGDSTLAEEATEQKHPHTVDGCIATSERLLHVLRAEAEALRAFQKERLLRLIPQKEALIIELAGRMDSLTQSKSILMKSGHDESKLPASSEVDVEGHEEDRAKRGLLKELLREIAAWNKKNRIFIQGSLAHWQQLLNLFLPGTYTPVQDRQAARQPIRAKGLALNREI